MTPRRTPLPATLLVALVAILASRSTAKATPAPPAWRDSEVHAGQMVELSLDVLPVRDVVETEILLSVDDGRHFGIRISPELDPRAGRYVWRVPNLAAARARIRLRYGTAQSEFETAPTRAFRIVADPRRAPDLALFQEGLAWQGFVDPAGGSGGAIDGSRALFAGAHGASLALPPERGASTVSGPGSRALPVASATDDFPPRLPRRARAPGTIPLRI